jgi:hypothetical protein
MGPELRDRFLTSRSLRNEYHVWLGTDDRGQPFAKDGMILDAQNANRFGGIDSQVSPLRLERA